MASEWTCPDDPSVLWDRYFCLNALSKDLDGELNLEDRKGHDCKEPSCKTLTTLHRLKVKVQSHQPCDSHLGTLLDGTLVVERLVTVFDQDGNHRGVHAGDFQWFGQGVQVIGRISGMTNVGTHREPAFQPCQRCDNPGVMEGRLCGQVVDTQTSELKRCQVIGVYRIRFDPQAGGGSSAVRGTFEGAFVCPCEG